MATKKTAEKSPAKAPSKTAAKSTPAKSAAKKAPAKTADKEAATKKAPSHQEISELAHKYYAERGHGHHGKHVDDWLRAEKELSK